MINQTITHFTNVDNMPSILSDGILKLEGWNVEAAIEQIALGNVSAEQVVHPSGLDIRYLWHQMCKKYRLIGRYVWLTEENDVRCITSQRYFEKKEIRFDADEINARRWVDVMDQKSKKSIKARKLIKHLNESATKTGDDITKWWVVDTDIPLGLSKSIKQNNKLAA